MPSLDKFTKMLKGSLIGSALLLSVATTSEAGVVRVFGDRYPISVIDNFYNSYGGHTSATLTGGTLDTFDLTGVNLLWAVQPADAYTSAELSTMAAFLAGGGRIAFMGEHGSFAPSENQRINSALTALGSDISIYYNEILDSGFRTASVGDGQILSHPLTAGVNTYEYAAFAPLNISGTAQSLMLGEQARAGSPSVMMAYQNIGAGSIFLITDQNVWDHASTLWGAFDNEIMFDNLVDGETGAPPVVSVPEPATLAVFGLGLMGLAFARRRRAR